MTRRTFALLAMVALTAILAAATEYILKHQPKPCQLVVTDEGALTFTPSKIKFWEMRKSERLQCAGTYVDRQRSMMRCVLPDDGSFVRSTQ